MSLLILSVVNGILPCAEMYDTIIKSINYFVYYICYCHMTCHNYFKYLIELSDKL